MLRTNKIEFRGRLSIHQSELECQKLRRLHPEVFFSLVALRVVVFDVLRLK